MVPATKRESRSLRGEKNIAALADRAFRSYKVGKHFATTVTEGGFSYERDEEKIAAEAALDGVYMIRTSVSAGRDRDRRRRPGLQGLQPRRARVPQLQGGADPVVEPGAARPPPLEGRVRAHVFVCTLAYYVEWHMRRAVAPLLFDDDDSAAAEADRASPIEPARRSKAARAKAGSKQTAGGRPVHSFRTLLADLATLTRNRVTPAVTGAMTADLPARPAPLQAKGLPPSPHPPMTRTQ